MMALTPKRLFLSLSASLSLFSALTLFSHAHLWSLKLSLKMRVSSNELFSTLKNTISVVGESTAFKMIAAHHGAWEASLAPQLLHQ